MLVLVLATGCTTRKINLAVDDGGTHEVSVVGDAALDGDSGVDSEDGAIREAGQDGVAGEDGDGTSSADFDEARDAGPVAGPARYVQFKCCLASGSNTCSEGHLGGPDACYVAADWKHLANDQCDALGMTFVGYGGFGDCSMKDAL